MYPDQIQANRRKALVALVVLALVGLLLFAVFSALNARGKVAVVFKTAPRQVIIKMNGIVVDKNTRVLPGDYSVTVEKEGFATYSQKLTVGKSGGTLELPVALTPITNDARDIAKNEQKVYGELEALGGERAQQEGTNFLKENPLVRYIPYKTGYYAIDYGRDNANNVVIQITASSPLGRRVALEKIRGWGYDPTDLRIQFLGFTNTLAIDAARNGVTP